MDWGSPMEEIDIWRAAEQMRKLFGADAAIHAAMRADKLMDHKDLKASIREAISGGGVGSASPVSR
jgi:hypothetical protein